MESIGEKLRQTREARGYTIEQIARDTHIAKRFLEALEHEDFGVFPGDPYLIGFMRTYSDYLGLDPEETVLLYKNLKLQEQPAPIDELISKRRPGGGAGRMVVAIVAVVVVLGVGAYFLFTSGLFDRERVPVAQDIPEQISGTTFELTGEWVEQRFAEGDRITVPVAGDLYNMDLVSVTDTLLLEIPSGGITVPVNEEVEIDLTGDDTTDVRVILRSTDTLDSPPTVVMRVNRGAPEPIAAAPQTPTVIQDTGSTTDEARLEDIVPIADFSEREEFFVEVRFEGYTLFRYEADDEPRVEQYFQQGQTLRISVMDSFRLWVSNAGAARLRVAGHDLTLGPAGRVSAALITWSDIPDSTNVRLELIPVY